MDKDKIMQALTEARAVLREIPVPNDDKAIAAHIENAEQELMRAQVALRSR